jgi:hypothetical protein
VESRKDIPLLAGIASVRKCSKVFKLSLREGLEGIEMELQSLKADKPSAEGTRTNSTT